MHRHGYTGRKFSRERDQRIALMRGLAVSLVEHGSVETTLAKAKELRPMIEKLVTKARKADLHTKRQIISSLNSVTASHKLVEQIAPAMKRSSGYTRIERTTLRRGDNMQLARISFIDRIEETADSKKTSTPQGSQAAKDSEVQPKKSTSTKSPAKERQSGPSAATLPSNTASNVAVAPKRTGRRGDR